MTWSTAGMSRPRAAISVARRTALDIVLKLQKLIYDEQES